MDRRALIIAASRYSQDPLPNTLSDAQKVAAALSARGFDSRCLIDATGHQIAEALERFGDSVGAAEISLIYFAGHGIEYNGAGFVLPVDFPFPIRATALKHFAVSTAQLVNAMNSATGVKILVLDACRNSVESFLDDGNNILSVLNSERIEEKQWDNLLVAYSTSAGDTASDGPIGANSQFCDAFCNALRRHELSVEDCFKKVGLDVMRESQRTQRPWSYSSLNASTSFSDLPRFKLIQTYKTALSKDVPRSLVRGNRLGSVFAYGGTQNILEVDISGTSERHALRSSSIAAAAAQDTQNFIVVDNEGKLWGLFNGKQKYVDTGISMPFGVRCARDGTTVVFGNEGWGLYRAGNFEWTKVVRKETTWAVHAGTVVGEACAWLAGSSGHIIAVNWAGKPQWRTIARLPADVNDLALVHDGDVLCAGGRGLLVLLNCSDGSIKKDFQQPERVTTPSARRGSLLGLINDDEPIARFIFHPDTLSESVRDFLEREMAQNQMLFCDAPPLLPICAAASNEGLVSLIDIREGQTFQVIDADAGRAQSIQGLCFINDSTLAILSEDSVVSFYSSGFDSVPMGPFLRDEAEDRLMCNIEPED